MTLNFSINNIKAIIGLGNPGRTYENNRHNIGFRIIDHIAQNYNMSWKEQDLMHIGQIVITKENIAHPIILIKPQTYMNNSGKVLHALQKKGIKSDEILVLHDELEKSFGTIHIRCGGSARGHNGLKSIIAIIGENFWRLRFGIGRPQDKNDVADYVLSNFNKEEADQIQQAILNTLEQLGI